MDTLQEYMKLSWPEKLEKFMATRSVTNRTAAYYLNWEKVIRNTQKYELELNTLNYLVGKPNIKDLAVDLFTKQPQLLGAIPTLIADRDYDLDVLMIDENKEMSFEHLNFVEIDENRIEDYIEFIEDTGLLEFLQHNLNKSLVDYAYGVEAGLDSNARKNRSGIQNEEILEINLEKITKGTSLEFATQVNAKNIEQKWGIVVPTDKSSRRFDGAVYNPDTNKVTLVETNFYGGGGSKLKSVAGEFTTLSKLVEKNDVQFVWISDGMGWDTARLPMSEAFEHIKYIINLDMVKKGYLKDIVLS